jgi:membrane protease YdiL (CAAX protease family)
MENDNGNLPEKPPEQDQNDNSNIKPVISPIAAAFIGLFGGFILYQVVGGILTLLVFGMDINHAPVNQYRLMTAAGQILFILLPALLFSKWFYNDVGKIIRIRMPSWQEVLLFLIGIAILSPLLQNLLYIQNYVLNSLASSSSFFNSVRSSMDKLDSLVQSAYVNLLQSNNFFEKILIVAVVAIVPAFCEETMFRGFIQRSFEMKMKPFWAALITAVFFGLYHFSPYGLIALVCLGFFFGFAAYTSETLVIPIILHFANNFIAVIMYFMYGNEELTNNPTISKAELIPTLGMLIGLTIVFFFLIYFIKRYYSKLKKA